MRQFCLFRINFPIDLLNEKFPTEKIFFMRNKMVYLRPSFFLIRLEFINVIVENKTYNYVFYTYSSIFPNI